MYMKWPNKITLGATVFKIVLLLTHNVTTNWHILVKNVNILIAPFKLRRFEYTNKTCNTSHQSHALPVASWWTVDFDRWVSYFFYSEVWSYILAVLSDVTPERQATMVSEQAIFSVARIFITFWRIIYRCYILRGDWKVNIRIAVQFQMF